jgi:hypothetical protein
MRYKPGDPVVHGEPAAREALALLRGSKFSVL